jgi:hypothetical protein
MVAPTPTSLLVGLPVHQRLTDVNPMSQMDCKYVTADAIFIVNRTSDAMGVTTMTDTVVHDTN